LSEVESALGTLVGLDSPAYLRTIEGELAQLAEHADTSIGKKLLANYINRDLSFLLDEHDILVEILDTYRTATSGVDPNNPAAKEVQAAGEIIYQMSLKLPPGGPFGDAYKG
jgi:hypothetical protein